MKVNILTLFIIGVIFSYSNRLSNSLMHYKDFDNWKIHLLSIFLKSLVGGSLAVLFYFGITHFYKDLPTEFLIAGCSVVGFFSEELFMTAIVIIKKRFNND